MLLLRKLETLFKLHLLFINDIDLFQDLIQDTTLQSSVHICASFVYSDPWYFLSLSDFHYSDSL